MKRLTLFVFLLTSLAIVQAQKVGDVVTFNVDVEAIGAPVSVYSNDLNKNKNANYLKAGYNFRIVAIDDAKGEVELRALDFKPFSKKKRERKKKKNINDPSELYNNKIYKIDKKEFTAYQGEPIQKDKLSIGLLSLPFKARPQDDFSFDTEFNLNSTLNYRFFSIGENTSFNIQIGAGIGTVGLNTSNAKGVQDGEAQDVSVLTFLSGFMLEYKTVQFGIYLGVDQINNQNTFDWESNGAVWFGFGIGYNLFKIKLGGNKNN